MKQARTSNKLEIPASTLEQHYLYLKYLRLNSNITCTGFSALLNDTVAEGMHAYTKTWACLIVWLKSDIFSYYAARPKCVVKKKWKNAVVILSPVWLMVHRSLMLRCFHTHNNTFGFEQQPFHLCLFSTPVITDQPRGPQCGGGNWETGRPYFHISQRLDIRGNDESDSECTSTICNFDWSY